MKENWYIRVLYIFRNNEIMLCDRTACIASRRHDAFITEIIMQNTIACTDINTVIVKVIDKEGSPGLCRTFRKICEFWTLNN